MWHGGNPLTGANTYPQLVDLGHRGLSRAQYVWLSKEASCRISWTLALAAYFNDNFTRVLGTPSNGALYRHDNTVNLLRRDTSAAKIVARELNKRVPRASEALTQDVRSPAKRETMSWQRSGQPASGS